MQMQIWLQNNAVLLPKIRFEMYRLLPMCVNCQNGKDEVDSDDSDDEELDDNIDNCESNNEEYDD